MVESIHSLVEKRVLLAACFVFLNGRYTRTVDATINIMPSLASLRN